MLAVCFGVVAGLGEGALLLLFQRVNWKSWGPSIHVSWPILWISPIVDVCLFVVLATLLHIVIRTFAPRIILRGIVFLLIFLTVYDWTLLTARLTQRACILLAIGVGVALSRAVLKTPAAARNACKHTLPATLPVYALAFIGIHAGSRFAEHRNVAALPHAAPNAPNVLVIVVDTLRADHLSAYGYARTTSPHLDRIASEGVLFENAISPSSWTLPSHASLLTGRTVFAHGLGNVQRPPWSGWDHSALNGYPTLAEALGAKGYATAGFSANGTFFTPQVGLGRGFSHFEDYFYSTADRFARTLYGRELTRIYFRRIRKTIPASMLGYGRRFIPRKRAPTVNSELLAWLDQRDPHRPFFAFLNYLDVHDPYGAPQSYPSAPWGDATPLDRYDRGIRYADDFIGKLDEALSRRGLTQNTILIVTSDHGEALGEHGLQHHGASLYLDLVHVPLLIRYPGHIPGGARVNAMAGNIAIPATVMDMLGDRGDPQFPGPTLQAMWASHAPAQSPAVISEVMQTDTLSPADRQAPISSSLTGWMESVMNSRWHLILHQDGTVQIYDWQDDAAELNNRFTTPEGRAAASDLMRQMDAARPPQTSSAR